MRFKVVKARLLKCLERGDVFHEQRGDIDIKNLLAIGEVSLDDVAKIIARARGDSYTSSPHHMVSSVDVHVVRIRHGSRDCYIKWYFVDPSAVFISVHH